MNNQVKPTGKSEITKYSAVKPLFNSKQLNVLNAKTPKDRTYTRPAKGGGEWTYVKGSYIRKRLDRAFGNAWTFEVQTSLKEAYEVALATKVCIVKGKLSVLTFSDELNQYITVSKEQFGRTEVKFKTENVFGPNGELVYETNKYGKRVPKKIPTNDPLDFGNDMKGAVTDCLKKCASLFGVAADIYEQEEYQEIILDEEKSFRVEESVVSEIVDANRENE